MQSGNRAIFARAVGAAGASVLSLALALALALTFGAAQAQDKTFVMKVTLPTINDAPHQFAKDFAALVEKDSGGRIKGEVYPASQLGSIPRQIEGMQFGAIQVATYRRNSSSASTSASRSWRRRAWSIRSSTASASPPIPRCSS